MDFGSMRAEVSLSRPRVTDMVINREQIRRPHAIGSLASQTSLALH